MKKIMLLLAVLVAAGTVVFAGGSRPAASTNVVRWSFWGGENRIRNYQRGTDIFTEETGIIVAGEPAPGTNEHFQKFLTQFAGGNAADIVQLGAYFTNLGVDDNDPSPYLLPLDQFVRSGVLNISTVDAGAIAAGTRNGILYALPMGTNMPCLLYNRSLLQRVGAPLPNVSMTWTEFEAWLTAVQARLPQGTYAITDNGATQSGSAFFGYWAGDNGTPTWTGTQTRMTAAAAQQYLEMWGRWRSAGLVPPATVAADYAETNESTSSLIAGRTAVCFAYTNYLINYQNATQDTLDLIELPNAAVSKGMWTNSSQMIAINKNSKNAEAAAKYINFRINDPRAWQIMGADPGIPITPSTRAVIGNDTINQRITAYMDVAGNHASPPSPNIPNDSEYNSGLFLIYQQVAYGRVTPAAGGQQIMDLINRLTR
ncbi:MAG: ABC transporter substrate-binding protein [Treponema sp.]|jgi:multiple sugar transport system substrate-binding protein|nr:ABC transporter substrate-binding protein [Treponema sp.]